MMKRSSDDQFMAMASNGGSMMMDVNADAKKAKMDGSSNKPSRVVHIRGVPNDATEGEVVQLGLPFGRMTNMVLARKKNQALLEMADIQTAQSMVNYYSERPPQIRGRTVYMQFSNHEQLKTESNSTLNAGAQAALQVADQMIGNMDEAHTVLRVVIENMLYPITVEILKMIFSKYGQVLRIVTYTKNGQFQALLQYSDAISAQTGRNALNGQNIYNGCCTLRIEFSKLQVLTVKYNNDRMWDFTNPNLPSGDEGQSQQGPEATNDGLLGSFNANNAAGAFGFGGMNNFGGNVNMGMQQQMQKLGGVGGGMGGGMLGMGGMMGGGGGGGGGGGNMSGINSMAGLGGLGNLSALGGMSGLAGLGGLPGIGSIPGLGAMGALGGMGGMMGMPPQSGNNVLIVSNLCEEKVNPDVIFTLFGVYGTVQRVKILYNKKDTALVQFADGGQAHNAMQCLDKVKWWGKNIKVSLSKHTHIQMPKESQSESWLTKDYTNSPLNRFKNPNSKNANTVNPPSVTLHLSNIAASASENDLKDLFGQYGRVIGFKFLMKEKKMALVQMESLDEAIEALVELHNYELDGSHLRVSFTKSSI